MKKVIVIGIIFLLLFVFGLNLFLTKLTNKVDNSLKVMKAEIGQKVLLGKDTLTVVDYSLVKDNYKLSNGAEVNSSLINKIKIK